MIKQSAVLSNYRVPTFLRIMGTVFCKVALFPTDAASIPIIVNTMIEFQHNRRTINQFALHQ